MAKRPQKKKEVNDLYKLTAQLRNVVVLVWFTLVAHFVYTTFLTDWWNLLPPQ